jgi:hypothetical protein
MAFMKVVPVTEAELRPCADLNLGSTTVRRAAP